MINREEGIQKWMRLGCVDCARKDRECMWDDCLWVELRFGFYTLFFSQGKRSLEGHGPPS